MVLVQDPLLRGAVPKLRHSDLEGSGGGVGSVSAAHIFLSNLPVLEDFSNLSSPITGSLKSTVPGCWVFHMLAVC